MADDHTKAGDELASIAKKQGFNLTKEASKQHEDICDKLSKPSGGDFDRHYINGQVKAHKDAGELFKNQSKNRQNADLRGFANKTLPTIEEHLKTTQEFARTVDKVNEK